MGCLAQGNDYGVKATDTIDFIFKHQVPSTAKVTYANFVCDHRPLKPEPDRIRLVVGGDKLHYDEDSGSPTTNMLETKILINSVISDADKGARFMTMDIKDHFLATPMKKPEYMRIHWRHIPEDIRKKYNLYEKVVDNYIYVKIKRECTALNRLPFLPMIT